jgi:hypothetical protein
VRGRQAPRKIYDKGCGLPAKPHRLPPWLSDLFQMTDRKG